MKYIFLLILVFNYLLAQSYNVDDNLTEDDLLNYTKYLVVPNESNLTAQEVMVSNQLKNLADSTIAFNPNNSVWTSLELKNDSNKPRTVFMLNLLVLTEKIDAFIFENNEFKTEYILGFLTDNPITYSKFPTLKLELNPHSSYTIVTRLANTTSRINPKWIIMSEAYFHQFNIQDNLIWGCILGTLFLLLLLYIILYVALKMYSYKNYLVCIFLFWLYLLVNNGFVMMIFGSGMYNTYLDHIIGFTPIIFYILFLDEYFALSKNKKYTTIMKIIYVYSIYLALASFVIMYSNVLYSYEDYYMVLSLIEGLILLLLTGIESYKNKISKLIILGEVSLLISYIYSSFMMDSKEARASDQQLVGIFTFIQILLFVIVIFAQLFKKAQLKDKTDKLILSQSHFATIGQTLRNIAHQWKIPSVRLGTLITELESIFYKENFLNKRADEVLEQMRSNANFMKETITEFATFYSGKHQQTSSFILINVINDIKTLLIEKMNRTNFTIECSENFSSLSIQGNERTFTHVCMIIIDNAIDIALQRNIKNPSIMITLQQNHDQVQISFEDNCGGIIQKPIDSIFELEITTHSEPNRGTGLAIAKMLVDSILKGKISVSNKEAGAKFDIVLRDQVP